MPQETKFVSSVEFVSTIRQFHPKIKRKDVISVCMQCKRCSQLVGDREDKNVAKRTPTSRASKQIGYSGR